MTTFEVIELILLAWLYGVGCLFTGWFLWDRRHDPALFWFVVAVLSWPAMWPIVLVTWAERGQLDERRPVSTQHTDWL